MDETDHDGTNDMSRRSGADFGVFSTRFDRMTEDESVPLKGETFADFEDLAEALAQTALSVVLEERAA